MTSVEQIEQVVQMAKLLERKVATGDEARQILKIGVWYDSVEETLANLGLPPNRKDGQLGFIVKDTDGKLGRQRVFIVHAPRYGMHLSRECGRRK